MKIKYDYKSSGWAREAAFNWLCLTGSHHTVQGSSRAGSLQRPEEHEDFTLQ